MHVESSMNTIAPDPSIVPASFNASKSMAMSVEVRRGAEAPPGMIALTGMPSRIPPARSRMS
jgi:hypothetical protein